MGNITIFNATITFTGGSRPEPWDTPLLLSFSEVDLDDENDPDMEFWVFCLLMSLAFVVLCCWCVVCDGECCCSCERKSASEEGAAARTTSKELGLRSPGACDTKSPLLRPKHEYGGRDRPPHSCDRGVLPRSSPHQCSSSPRQAGGVRCLGLEAASLSLCTGRRLQMPQLQAPL